MEYSKNNFRFTKLGDSYLVVADHGKWIVLDRGNLDLLLSGDMEKDKNLFSLLEENGLVVTESNRDKIIQDIRNKYGMLFQGTSLHIVVPTLRCNQNCVYCHASSKPEDSRGHDMDEETALKTVDFIFQSPSRSINIEFQGGEPLLRFDLVKLIIERARELNRRYNKLLVISLVTNMTLMDDEKLEYLIDKDVGICTSLDGPALLHNKNRPYPGGDSHSMAVKWISRIKEEYSKRGIENRRANALITITRESLKHSREIVDEYLRLGMDDVYFRPLNNLGQAKAAWSGISYTPDEYIDFWKKTVDYILELNRSGKDIREWFTWIMLRKIISNEEPNFFEQRSPCGAAIGQLAYDYNGDIFSCDEARMIGEDIFRLGNVRENSYREIMTSDQACALIASSVNDTHFCDTCAFKPFCGLCPVCNYSEHGSTIPRITETSRCKIFMAQFRYVFNKVVNEPESMEIFRRWIAKR